MDTQTAEQILMLAIKWQESGNWQIAYRAAERFEEYRKKATDNEAAAKRMRDAGQPGEMVERFQHGAERYDELSEENHAYVVSAHQEFLDLTNLLRKQAPTLLELVPQANFFDPPVADRSALLRDLRKLEGAVRAAVEAASPLHSTPLYLDLMVNRDARTVERKGCDAAPILLSTKRWEALLLLMDARGETVPLQRFEQPKYSGKGGSALRNVLNDLGDDLYPLEVAVIDRALKDCRQT